jgi:glycine/D-amino acid oxidase-like deaminating enzyme
VNPKHLHEALSRAVSALGIKLYQGRILEVFSRGKLLNQLQLDDGRKIDFDILLAATGAWTDDIARLLDLTFSIRPVKGQLARIGTPDGMLRHVLHLKNLYLAPRPGEGLIVGSTMEDIGFDLSINKDIIAHFLEQATELVPGLSRYGIAEAWVGFRPRSADGLPIIGWSDRWENLLIATGHFRNGILLTPLTARIVGELMENRESLLWDAFSPNREQLKAGPTAP